MPTSKLFVRQNEHPREPIIDPSFSQQLKPEFHQLGLSLQLGDSSSILYGKWYELKKHNGIFTSLFIPNLIDRRIKSNPMPNVNLLKKTETNNLIYMTAYDLKRYSLRYIIGTQHPGIEHNKKKDLVPIGSIPPYHLKQAAGVIIGGFKDRHSLIKSGPHKGKRYGYIESGVELAPLAEGLATLIVKKNGDVAIKPWPQSKKLQDSLKQEVISARQNGVMMIENGLASPFINKWRAGNWSGSATGLGMTLRAGICLQKTPDSEYLLFMAFTGATPSAMARTMIAYGCQDAMHLDMNAYMYLHNAIYNYNSAENIEVEYLHREMLYPPKLKKHRFIMDNNSRDFFYILKK